MWTYGYDVMRTNLVSSLFTENVCREEDKFYNLLVAVVERAYKDLLDPKEISGNPGAAVNIKNSARKWFRALDQDPFSYLWICEIIDIDPNIIIEHIKKRGLL